MFGSQIPCPLFAHSRQKTLNGHRDLNGNGRASSLDAAVEQLGNIDSERSAAVEYMNITS